MIFPKIIVAIMIAALFLISPSKMTFALVIQDGVISGVVWEDDNNNNTQELSELGIKNIKVYVQNKATNETFSTETAEDGRYSFLDLISGEYQLWYEHEGNASKPLELEIDELNGIMSLNIPLSIPVDNAVDRSTIPADTGQHHIVYLPIILR